MATKNNEGFEMAKKNDLSGHGTVALDQEVHEFELTLNEFCTRLSEKERRVELIGAFNNVERAAGRNKDFMGAYHKRFDAFVNQPA